MIGKIVQCLGGTPNELHRPFAGTIHTVREPVHCITAFLYGQAYYLDPPTISEGMELCWTPDFLRVIDNPGEDAVDEMVRRVPLPLPEIIPAMLDREVEHG